MEGGGGGGGERSCRDNYNDREHKADEARGGGGQRAERKQSRDTTNAFERGVCVRAVFFLFFLFFFSTYPFTYPGKGRALFLRLFISNWWRIGFDEETREIERLCALSKERE